MQQALADSRIHGAEHLSLLVQATQRLPADLGIGAATLPQMSIAILLIIAEAALGLIVLFIAQAWLLLSPGRQQRVNHPPCNSPSRSKSKLIWSELFQISLTSTLCCCFGLCWTLNVDQFCRELSRHHNTRLVASVLEGIHHGFKKGFSHLQPLRSAKWNKPLV